MRSTRPQLFMEIAQAVAKRSTCMRLNVGAVLVQGRSIVSIGYNGAPPGEPHCTQETCNAQTSCQRTIHAEDNALRHVPQGIRVTQDTRFDLYVTDSPCQGCFNMIKDAGVVKRIFFSTPYRITDHLEHSGACDNYVPSIIHMGDCVYCGHTEASHTTKIAVYRVLPSGYVIDWETKDLVNVET